MKNIKTTISLQRETLQNALKLTSKIAPNKPQLPILSHLLFSLENNDLTISSTDLYLGVQAKIKVSSQVATSFTIPGILFRDVINSFNSDLVELEILKEKIIIKSNGSIASIPIQNSIDFPEFPLVKTKKATLSTDIIKKIDQLVCFAAGVDLARPILTTLLIKLSSSGLEAVATDGFRLSLLKIPEIISEEEESLLIPARFFSEVCRVASLSAVEEVNIFIDKKLKQIRFEVGANNIFVRQIEGEYPPYEKIIPTSFNLDFSIDSLCLEKELKRASILAKEESNIVEMSLSNSKDNNGEKPSKESQEFDEIVITTPSTIKGSYKGSCPLLKSISPNIPIAFNVNYLLDFLNSVKPEIIQLKVNESLKPILVKISNEKDFQYIIMPFRVNS